MSINNVPTRLQTSKRDIRALGQLVKTPGAQVVFFSLLAVTGNGGTGWRYLQRVQAAKYITTDYGTSLCTPTGILAHSYFYKAPAYQSTRNKQEQLEMCVQSQSFDLIAETDTVG